MKWAAELLNHQSSLRLVEYIHFHAGHYQKSILITGTQGTG